MSHSMPAKNNKVIPIIAKQTQSIAPDTPHNEELEMSVIGCALRYPTFFPKLDAEIGNNKVFYLVRHQMIFDAMRGIIAEGGDIDNVTVANELIKRRQLADIGGPAYLTKLLQATLSRTGQPDFDYYIKMLKGYYARWQLLKLSDEIEKQAYDMSINTKSVLHNVQLEVSRLGEYVLSDVFKPMVDTLQEHADKTESGGNSYIPTGIRSLDNFMSGFVKQKVYVIAGRTHHGKTSVGMSMMLQIARAGGRVAIFNVADGNKNDVLSRLVAMEGGLNYADVMMNKISSDEHGRYIAAMSRIGKLPITIQSKKGMTIEQLYTEARAIHDGGGLDMIFIDYIQRLTVDTTRGKNVPKTEYEQLAYISQAITKTAEILNVPILVAAQINRAGIGKMPEMSHIKGCGNIEADSDMVLICYRDYLDEPSHVYPLQIQVRIAKNKVNGKCGIALTQLHASGSTYVTSK